jgi:CheY-like chemotaxis protein
VKSYTVEKAYDGVEAMEKVAENKPALVILDVMMPRKNGWEVCEQIKTDTDTQGYRCGVADCGCRFRENHLLHPSRWQNHPC